MAAGTKVQLRLGERVVSEVPFSGDELRIGRMKENDLVVNNLAVSRFHAVLRRLGDGFEVEDLGSENGTFVDGVRIRGCAPLPAGAAIGLGKHVLTIASGSEAAAAPLRAAKSDVWDAAQTYFAPELAPRAGVLEPEPESGDTGELVAAVEEPAAAEARTAESVGARRRPPAAFDLPDPEERFAFGEAELLAGAPVQAVLAPPPELDVPAAAVEAETAAPVSERGSETALFDFAPSTDLGLSEPSLARAAAARTTVPAGPAPLHAGLIVARGGRVECVVPLRGAELVLGRSPGCDLVLATAGISRRHARFVRDGRELRVQDLGSANGLAVNGERVLERVLEVGDVVDLEDYTLTYVVDHEPLEQAVRSTAPVRSAAASGAPGSGHVTILHDAPLAGIPERDLVVDADDDEGEDLEKEPQLEVEQGTLRPRFATASAAGRDWVVEVVLAADRLPPALRAALAELSASELRLPAELRLRRS